MQLCTKHLIISLLLCSASMFLEADDTITITTPTNGSMTSGLPLMLSGHASESNMHVKLILNTTILGYATTDAYGNWNFILKDLHKNGIYTLTAQLTSNAFEILATASSTFTVDNAEIIIITPQAQDTIFLNPSIAQGSSSSALADVQLLIDDNLVATTTTGSDGSWQVSYELTSNGAHTLSAQLMAYGLPVATDDIDITVAIPVFSPGSTMQRQIIAGIIPTNTVSGSGPGYTYTISSSIISISFTQAFLSIPTIVATGQHAYGLVNVSLTSVSTNSVSLIFDTNTEQVHFIALMLL